MRSIFVIFLVALISGFGCKSSKPNGSKTPETQAVTEGAAQPAKVNDDGSPAVEETYRVIVSFISIGEGTDPKARELLDAYVKDWKERNGSDIEIVEIPWGREGEVDLCFTLKELSSDEQAVFADEIKTLFNENQLIQITENQKSRLSK